jgi:hypothetical protein
VSRDQELDNWLSKATAGLCDEAKSRIATEIESHVRGAITDLREQGIDEVDAMRGAVATLGNVEKARRAFRRIHLTEWEANTVRRLNEPPDPLLPLPYAFVPLYLILVPLFLIGIIVAIRDANLWLLIGTLSAPVAIGMLIVVAQRVSQRPRPKRSPTRIILDRAIGNLGCGIIFVLLMSMYWSRPFDIDRIVFDAVFTLPFASWWWIFDAYRYLRLWRKLMRPSQPSSRMDTGFQDGHT